jgi:hypothetical protein
MSSLHRALTLAGLAGALCVPIGCGGDDGGGTGSAGTAGGSGGTAGSAGSGATGGGGTGGTNGGGTGGTSGSAGAGTGGSSGAAGESGAAGADGGAGVAGAAGTAGAAGAAGASGTAGTGGTGGSAGSSGTSGSAGTSGTGGDPCASVDCGDNGTCSAGSCACAKGWTGASCESCAPGYRPGLVPIGTPSPCVLDEPTTTNMKVWLDATQTSTFDFDTQGKVLRWRSRVASDTTAFNDGGKSASRPSRPLTIGGNAWVSFDGVDDGLRRLVDLSGDSYSVYLVVRAASDGPTVQTPLSAVQPSTTNYGLIIQTQDKSSSVFYRHTFPFSGPTSDAYSAPAFPTTGASVLELHRTGGGFQYWDGDSIVVDRDADTAAFGEPLLMELGRRADSGTFPFKGSIGELIVISPAPASQDRTEVREYLQAKWR